MEFWINRYQTLIGAGVAIVAASFALRPAREQIAFGDSIEKRRRADEQFAARAVLPISLSQVTQYTMDCQNSLLNALRPASRYPHFLPLQSSQYRTAFGFADPDHAVLLAQSAIVSLGFFVTFRCRSCGIRWAG